MTLACGRDVEKCMNSMKILRKVATFSCRNTIRTEEDNCFKLAAAQPATGNYIDVASDNRPPTQTAFFQPPVYPEILTVKGRVFNHG